MSMRAVWLGTTGAEEGRAREYDQHPWGSRLAAIAAILLILAVVIGTLVRFVDDPLRVIAELVLLAVIVGAGWIALTRAGTAASSRPSWRGWRSSP